MNETRVIDHTADDVFTLCQQIKDRCTDLRNQRRGGELSVLRERLRGLLDSLPVNH